MGSAGANDGPVLGANDALATAVGLGIGAVDTVGVAPDSVDGGGAAGDPPHPASATKTATSPTLSPRRAMLHPRVWGA